MFVEEKQPPLHYLHQLVTPPAPKGGEVFVVVLG